MALGILMGCYRGERDRFLASVQPIKPVADFAHPDRFHDRQRWIEPFGKKRLNFLNGTARKHLFKPRGNSGAQNIAVGRKHETLDAPALQRPLLQIILKR
ncbi:hypothetical protein SAMN05216456_1049 [Devosia crocina]|uniref:Uncharacterized protein n=1 Tax=Devosia crocina TaxID=429728 RepID=A0A1I7N776_9HYPH|nr:hypothetical protein SAMN05216456_1049 [Devosia crocina]